MLSEASREVIFNLIKDNHSTIAVTWHSLTGSYSAQVIYGDQDIDRSYPSIAMDWRSLRGVVAGMLGNQFDAEETLYLEIAATNELTQVGSSNIPGSVIARRAVADIIYEAENNWNVTLLNQSPKVAFMPPVVNIVGMRGRMEDQYIYTYAFIMKFIYIVDRTQTI